jgi:hypothetical protein
MVNQSLSILKGATRNNDVSVRPQRKALHQTTPEKSITANHNHAVFSEYSAHPKNSDFGSINIFDLLKTLWPLEPAGGVSIPL